MLIKRGFAGWAALTALAVVLTACGGVHSRFLTFMKRGQEYYAHNDFSKAMVEFRNAIQIAPKDPAARVMAARTAERLGRIRDAAGLYQFVIDAAPENIEARQGLARLLIYANAPDPALKIIQPGLTLHPDDPTLLALRAAAQIKLNKPEAAVADADHALRVAPTNEEAIEIRARLYQQKGDLTPAMALVNDGVKRSPKSTALREVLTSLYLSADQPEQAEHELRELIALAPQEPRYRYQLAEYYRRTHQADAAQRVLEEAVKALPGNDQVKLALVEFISTERTRAQGEQVLRDFIAREPRNYALRLSLGQLLQRFGSTKEATHEYQEVVRLDGTGPDGLAARDRLAAIALAEGRDSEARQLIQQVLVKSPHDLDVLMMRGRMELESKDAAAAVVDLRSVVKDQPENVEARRLLAQAHLANGEPALAAEALNDAIKVAPRDDSLAIALAQVMMQTQRPDDAVTVLEQRTQAAPTDPRLRDALIRAYLAKGDFLAAGKAANDLKILRPESADGFYLAGLAAQGQKRLDAAQQEFERALVLQPKALDALSALAHLEYNRGRTAQAIALVKSASERKPADAYSFNLLAELYLTERNFAAATDALTQAMKLAPRWWVPYRSLAVTRISAQDVAGAIAAYQEGIKAAPGEPQLVVELAQLYDNQGRVGEAIACYEEGYRNNPRAQLLANNLAMMLVTYRKDQKSLDRARDLTEGFASSNNGSLLDTGGWVHFKRAEYAQALPELERAVQRSPQSSEIRYHLGMAEARAGLTERARNDLETAIAGSAKFTGSSEARTVLATLKGPG